MRDLFPFGRFIGVGSGRNLLVRASIPDDVNVALTLGLIGDPIDEDGNVRIERFETGKERAAWCHVMSTSTVQVPLVTLVWTAEPEIWSAG